MRRLRSATADIENNQWARDVQDWQEALDRLADPRTPVAIKSFVEARLHRLAEKYPGKLKLPSTAQA